MTRQQTFNKHRMNLFILIQKYLKMKVVYYFVMGCIAASIGALFFASFDNSSEHYLQLFGITYISSFIFLIEYLLRLISAPANTPQIPASKARRAYIFSFFGFVDFVGILPFMLAYLFLDTQYAELVILPYIFIIFKMIRYSKALRTIGQVLYAVRNELMTAYTACGIMVCFSAIIMYYIERNAQPEAFENIGDGLWWAIVAFTTVGYGDIYPITPFGKILSSVISLIGIAMIALPTGIISSSFINSIQKRQNSEKQK